MEAGVVQHDHAARRRSGAQRFFKTGGHDRRGATALKHQRGDQLALLRSGAAAGAFPPLARHGLVDPRAPRGPTKLTLQAVIRAALVQVKDGRVAESFPCPSAEPPWHLVARAIL